ncbi:MAG TPA: S41 family peptidase [Sedimentisphaerales bacterium]|nr:S41 family peptidase [Sedimentisphaerales bacterium]
MDKTYDIRRHLIGIVWVLLVVFCSSGYGLAAKPKPVEPLEAESAEPDVVESACELICEGQFDGAGKLIEKARSPYNTALYSLSKIVHEYQAISQARQAAREAAYLSQLAELEKLRIAPPRNDANDANALSEMTKVLSVIAKASEFANEKQKSELLSDPFVKRVFQEAKSKAAEFESKGKWLDAYVVCYSWLQAIEPDNKQYEDYAEQLVEKANIGSSFQDNSCESRQERYEKVEPEMFIRAIEALNFSYVNIIDYRQMAVKAIRRCQSLEEVIDSSSVVRDALWEKGSQHGRRAAAWSAALEMILDEINRPATGLNKSKFIDIFQKVLALNATTLELPRELLISHFAEAAFSALDPYTVMVWPRQVQDFEKTMTNEFTGIGIEITKQKGLLTVASLLPDTPAYNSGLDAGDVIEKVDDAETKDMSLTCAVRKITGPAGTTVTLMIRRPGEDKTRDISITRAKIVVPTIRGWRRAETGKWLYMIDDESKTGYVRLTNFSGTTSSDLEKVLKELEAEGLRGLILDLRFNTGGLLDSAVAIADKFLTEGLIVRTQPRWGTPTYAPAHKDNTHPDYPLVILVNRASASASEIVAGALQDRAYRRAVIVGERTVGKGLVQGITSYPGGGAQLKYTMAYYHLPSGQRVESQEEMKKQGRKDWGIGPDIEMELTGDELKELIDVQRDNDVLVQANHDKGAPLKRHTLEETLKSDPQLAVGILVAKSKLIRQEARGANRRAAKL